MDWTILSIYLMQGLLLGIQGGVSPGPLTTLVISESLSHGRRAGMKCALAPLFSDPPVILVSLLVLDKISGTKTILGCISLLGAILLAWIASGCFKVRAEQFEKTSVSAASLPKVVSVNFLNPNLYVYAMTILGPICIEATRKHGVVYAAVFIFGSYTALVSTIVTLAFIAGGARHRINGRWLVFINRLLGLAMLAFVIRFAYSGISMLGSR